MIRNMNRTVATGLAIASVFSVSREPVVFIESSRAQAPEPGGLVCDPGDHVETVIDVESETKRCVPDDPDATGDPVPSRPANGNHNKKSLLDYYHGPFGSVKRLRAMRIDMGVDYAGEGDVHAIGKAVVTVVSRDSNFWAREGGDVVVYKLSEGPAKGRSVFVSENCTPNSRLFVGKHLTRNSVVCHMHNKFPFIETGWAMKTTNPKLKDHPAAWPHYTPAGNPDGSMTRYGKNFSDLMGRLGEPRGNSNPRHVSTNPGKLVGRLPADFPRWR